MEIISELIFGFIAELVLTFVGEAIAEIGFHSLAETLGTKFSKRVLLGFLYSVGAVILGALSLQLLPLMVVGSHAIPILYFIISPLIAGLGLCFVSWIVNRGINDQGFFQLDKFIYGALFALVFSITRSIFG